jgi:hypothetical protein
MRKELMKTLTSRLSIFLAVIAMFMACKKEMSLENGLSAGLATGELVDSMGYCKRADVQGTYKVDTPLVTTTNYAVVSVNFTSQGKYKIYSDTVNGMWFIDSGFTVTTGQVSLKIRGYGTPILPKITDFSLFFNNTLCTFSVNVGGTVSGGGTSGSTGSNGDYFPTTSGSSFAYAYSPAIAGTTNFTIGVGEGLVAYNGLNYAKFGTNSQDTFYFAKDGAGVYYALSTIDFDYTLLFDSYPTGNAAYVSYPFLKEAANVGQTWETAEYAPVVFQGTKGTAKAIFSNAEKNISYTVGGKTYTQVISVERIIMFKPDGGNYSELVRGNSYYAKNFGLIDQVIKTYSQKVSLTATPIIK